MTACAYAACTRPGVTVADGWAFCARHHQAHTELAHEDQHRVALDGHVSGRLLPSLSLTALLDVLGRYEREAA